MIGITSKKENFVLVTLSKPVNKPVAIVQPERENPDPCGSEPGTAGMAG